MVTSQGPCFLRPLLRHQGLGHPARCPLTGGRAAGPWGLALGLVLPPWRTGQSSTHRPSGPSDEEKTGFSPSSLALAPSRPALSFRGSPPTPGKGSGRRGRARGPVALCACGAGPAAPGPAKVIRPRARALRRAGAGLQRWPPARAYPPAPPRSGVVAGERCLRPGNPGAPSSGMVTGEIDA